MPTPDRYPAREGSGPERLHDTCVDVSAVNEHPGSAWICVRACGDLYITLECRWCPWIAEIETPVVLADVIQRGDEHMETCGRGR